MIKDTIDYIISFLLYGDKEAANLVGYTANQDEAKQYKIVFKPSPLSPLNDPQRNWQDFYPEVEKIIQTRSINDDMDIVSFVCFFLSRAEETVVKERDSHGRMLAKHSILGKHSLVNIPLLDEFSRHLLKRLNRPLPEQAFSQINLTHDVDRLTVYRSLRGMLGGIKRGEIRQMLLSIKDVSADPAWTFNWLLEKDKQIAAKQIYFFKAGDGTGYDCPQYNLQGKDFKTLLELLNRYGAEKGLHISYSAGEWSGTTPLMGEEKERLEKAIGHTISKSRHHYLRSTTIDNMQQLADTGITDDYSMGFADQAGFRLLTSRAVRWINPKTLALTPLVLHPLTIMDCSLWNSNYMNLNEEEAYYTCQQLIDKTRQNNGELTLLWHNDNINKGYNRTLYQTILEYISE